jgi:autotransporter-associated beta strand protein
MDNRFGSCSNNRLAVSGLLALAAACFCPASAHAANKTWVGTFGPNWSDGDNWSPSGVPAATGDVLIWGNTSTGNLTSNNDIAGLTTSLTFNTNIPGNVTLGGQAITLNGNVSGAFTGTVTVGIDLAMSASRTFGLTGANSRLNLNGVISGGTSAVLTVSSDLTSSTYLTAANTFGATVTVTRGNVYINTLANTGVAQSLGVGSNVNFGFGSSATTGNVIYTGSTAASTNKGWNLGQLSTDVNRIHNGGFFNDGGGAVTWNGTQALQATTVTARTFTLGGSNTDDNTWATAIQNNNNINGGTVNLTKTGLGKWILGGASTYTGATAVQQGTLLVNGSTAAGSAVAVSLGAILGGTGTIGGVTTISGILAPGSGGIGTLSMSNGATWNAGNAWLFQLGTPAASLNDASTSTNNDLLNVTGAFTQGSGSTFAFDFSNTGSDGWYKLVDYTSTTFATGTNTTFTASNVPSGKTATFVVDSASTALYVQIVPEPGALVLLGGGMAIGGGLWRRRSRRSRAPARE